MLVIIALRIWDSFVVKETSARTKKEHEEVGTGADVGPESEAVDVVRRYWNGFDADVGEVREAEAMERIRGRIGVKGKRRGAWEAPRLTSRRLFHRGGLGCGFEGFLGGGQGEGIVEGLGRFYGWFLLGC